MATKTVHLVNPFTHATGGSEWHAFSLFEILAEYTEVNLWTEFKPDPSLTGKYPIRGIEPHRGVFPKRGTVVFIGVYYGVGPWVKAANFERAIVFFNTPDPDRLRPFVEGLRSAGIPNVEVAYQAEEHRDIFPEFPGPVHPSPIDLEVFSAHPKPHEGFVVGRYSRDADIKHHEDDADLYRRLADAGCQVRIMGGLSQRERIADSRIELLEAGSVPPAEFLSGLDCFLYRVRGDVYEAFGRVIAEAMASEVPVVAEDRGGYTFLFRNGENGFLFKDNAEALQQVLSLREKPGLRKEIGAAARQTIVDLFSPEVRAEIAEFYYR